MPDFFGLVLMQEDVCVCSWEGAPLPVLVGKCGGGGGGVWPKRFHKCNNCATSLVMTFESREKG